MHRLTLRFPRPLVTSLAIALLGEPIGSALLAWLIFGESFALLQLAGFVLLLVGIYVAARGESVDR